MTGRWPGWGAVSLALAALVGCGGPAAPVVVTAQLDRARPGFGSVTVSGLPAGVRARLAPLSPGDSRWHRVLSVRAASGDTAIPPLAGRYGVTPDGTVRFEPRFPPDGPLDYVVRVRPDGRGGAREWRFRLAPVPPRSPSTVVLGVHPSDSLVPANLLRWYLDFSAPMREGEAPQRVHLFDDQGREIAGAFLATSQELWDPARRRLTLLFDPGRVKRGLRTHLEVGPVLRPGRRYVLRVDAGWLDARGVPLGRPLTHRFVAGPPEYRPVEPERWSVRAPLLGSEQALEIRFGRVMDHALAGQLLAVEGPLGRVRGRPSLVQSDRVWRFTPAEPWLAGWYRVVVDPALEDVAGNRPGHAFDADLAAGAGAGRASGPALLRFVPRGGDHR